MNGEEAVNTVNDTAVPSQGSDLGDIVNLILSHPELVEKVAALAKETVPSQSATQEPAAPIPTAAPAASPGADRFLLAVKPFVNPRRAKAIDSMRAVLRLLSKGGV